MENSSNNKASNNEHNIEITTPVAAEVNLQVEQRPIQKVNTFTRICSVLTTWERLYTVTALLFVIVIWSLAMSILFASHKSSSLELALIYTVSFCLSYIAMGMVSKKPFELMGFVVLIFLVLAYSIINCLSDPYDDLKLASLIFASIFGSVLVIAGVRLSYRFYLCGVIFHHLVGANAYLQYLCKITCLCSTLLRFDFHMQINLILLIAQNGSDAVHSEKIVFFLTLLFAVIGDRSMKHENKILTSLFLIISISQPIYTIYIFSVAKNKFKMHHIQYFAIYISGGLGLAAWISSVICMWFVVRNFGKGLKEKVYGATRNNS